MIGSKQNLILENIRTVYLIGIGGIGMSALARYFKSKEVEVLGSDRDLKNETVKKLIAEGFQIIDQNAATDLPEKIDLVVKTLAIPEENLELKSARDRKIPVLNYAEILGEISKLHFTIAVSGTHGKTTTTAMTFEIAKNLNLDPTVIVGSFLNYNKKTENDSKQEKIQTNFVAGQSDLFIVEACEYGRSFLNLDPNILIITNLEADHLDYYKDLADLKQAFYDLASKIPTDGKIICNIYDPNLKEIVDDFSDKIIDYSNLVNQVEFDFIFGNHNKQNGAASICAIREYLLMSHTENILETNIKTVNKNKDKKGIEQTLLQSLKSFSGTWRRMEYKGMLKNGVKIYDDYAHHPTEVAATLNAFKENFPNKKIAIFFGPHLHSRTKMFFDKFVESLSLADRTFVYPIFKARAEKDFGVSAEILVDAINTIHATGVKFPEERELDYEKLNKHVVIDPENIAKFVPDFDSIIMEINKLDNDWIVILLGAGDVYQVAQKIDLSS